MSKFKIHFIINCISFTYIILCLCFINKLNFVDYLPIKAILQLFLMTTLVQVVMFFTDKLPIKSTPLSIFIQLFDIFIVVFPVGIYFKFFNLTLENIVIISIINISLYIFIYLLLIIRNQLDAFFINTKINNKNKRSDMD